MATVSVPLCELNTMKARINGLEQKLPLPNAFFEGLVQNVSALTHYLKVFFSDCTLHQLSI